MDNNIKKKFQLEELKWGAIKKYEGIEGKSVALTFESYIVFFKNEDGLCINALNQKEVYNSLEDLRPFRNNKLKEVEEGTSFVETISNRADIILYRAFNLSEKDTFSIKNIEDAVLESDAFYFKDAERIRIKRESGLLKQKVKRYKI